jgi:hypothetical protein
VLAEQRIRRGRQGPQVQGVGHVPGQPGQQWIGYGRIDVAGPAERTTMAGPAWALHEATTRTGSRRAATSAGRSTWTTWWLAWTPASVRPAQVIDTGT